MREENVRIPQNTASWAKDILPYEGEKEKEEGSNYLEVENILSVNWEDEKFNKHGYLAILMDPPWKTQSSDGSGITVDHLKDFIVPKSVLFIFVWIEKELIPGIVKYTNFFYVYFFIYFFFFYFF